MIRNKYAIDTQSIRSDTQLQYANQYAYIRIYTQFTIRNSQYAIAQNVNTHDTQIPFSIRINTHPYAVGSLLMRYAGSRSHCGTVELEGEQLHSKL